MLWKLLFVLCIGFHIWSLTVQESDHKHIKLSKAEIKLIPSLDKLPSIYNGTLISEKDVQGFFSKAQNVSKLAMVVFGSNYCPDSKMFNAIMALPTVNHFVENNFELLQIDLGKKYAINMNLWSALGVSAMQGMPRVFIFSPNGQLINKSTTGKWRKSREIPPQYIFDYFQGMARRGYGKAVY